MKFIALSLLIFLSTVCEFSIAQQTRARRSSLIRKGVLIDYNSWNDTVTVESNGEKQSQKVISYGTGISYDWSELKSTFGYGFNGGIISAFAVTGKSSDTNTYFIKRNPFLALRGSARLFQRVNSRFDLGLSPSVTMTTLKWKNTNTMTAKSPSTLILGLAIDARYRLNRQWELNQSFGVTQTKNSSLSWRVGGGYFF